MKLPEIVGISGTNGAGKDELGILLAEYCGYHFHSVTDLLREELGRQGKEITRENLANLSKQWRNETGDDGVMFTKAIESYNAEKETKRYKGLALASIRHPGEVTAVHRFGGVTVWVDADEQLRYQRISSAKRGRAEDLVTIEQFRADHYREMHPPADAPPGSLNMGAVKDAADIQIENDFPSVELYRAYLIERFEM